MRFNFKIILNNEKIREYLFFIGVLFLILLPKGGFKIAGIPITWGYLYLGFLFLLSILIILDKRRFLVSSKHFLCWAATLPFVIYFSINLLFRGYDGSFGNLIAFYVSFGFLPLLFYIFLSSFLKKINQEFVENLLTNAVFWISLYGIILFAFKQITGSYIEIPYLTVNADDLGTLEGKYNMRGSLYKLISTYNNGNIFGVCMLMLFPIFHKQNVSKIKLGIVILALLLTLSRTVWLGLLFYFVLIYRDRVFKLVKVYAFLGLILFVFATFLMNRYFQYGSLSGFILDSNLGGRISQIKQFTGLSFFGSQTFDFIEEIVYLSIFKQLGIVGLILFLISFFSQIYVALSTRNNNYPYLLGSLTYLFVCLSDGCMLYIPTLAFFYFINTMIFIPKKSA
ncbi:hypothetical protein [Flavobacterium sp. S87F.05.LMB.W.Kidney.N]|uniref:hypothetical protein n=1 Tax=Flavobacterium sp. S87F.05.LMB.W.Kidney.N TaxID=1278758 RepID=UPI0010646AE2|nr:hypothetical protein [Flavobacterium sp. S87F.05.LMB.W.Kidney.N]TDX13505.1 hypothetical protein EDB96_0200 [Flavobacterium sp. S87F.05.LMB.W.Kidney.N]